MSNSNIYYHETGAIDLDKVSAFSYSGYSTLRGNCYTVIVDSVAIEIQTGTKNFTEVYKDYIKYKNYLNAIANK